jgi:hypothetical protein
MFLREKLARVCTGKEDVITRQSELGIAESNQDWQGNDGFFLAVPHSQPAGGFDSIKWGRVLYA